MKTHCVNGHELTENNLYFRPDGTGRMCRSCMQLRQRRRHPRQGQGQGGGRPSGLHPGATPARIVDLLDLDGGWLTAAGIALALDKPEGTVKGTLQRLRGLGFVASRVVQLAGRNESRIEWRTWEVEQNASE